jgi:hypothetical protein
MTNQELRAKREGRNAWGRDYPLSLNPYRHDEPKLREAWRDGWIERDAGQQMDANED